MTKKSMAGMGVVLLLLGIFMIARTFQRHDEPPGNARLEKMAADVNAIAQRSGGNWEQLQPSEKALMLQAAHGNESGAKQLLMGLSGRTYEGKWGKPGPRPPIRAFGNTPSAPPSAVPKG